jgi:hypothetical protein
LTALRTQKRSPTTPIRPADHVGNTIADFGLVSDRRDDKRFRLTNAAEGTVRMYPDVIVEPLGADEWIARGREAAIAGEILTLDLVQLDAESGELRHRLPVCVIDSHPIILDGRLRHRIRLRRGKLAPVLVEEQVTRR